MVLGLDHPAAEKNDRSVDGVDRPRLRQFGRTFKSALIFAVADSAEPIRAATRDLLAWEDIDDDEDTKKRLDESQNRLADTKLSAAPRAT